MQGGFRGGFGSTAADPAIRGAGLVLGASVHSAAQIE